MNQIDCFDAVRFPRVRTTDVRSSHEAAGLVERTGIAKKQAEQVLAALKRFPNSTSMELARFAGLDRYAVARRLPELAAANLVNRIVPTDAMKPCEISAKRVCRWEAK